MIMTLPSKDTRETISYGVFGIIVFLIVWQGFCMFTDFGRIFPTPAVALQAFLKAFIKPIGKQTLLGHISISLRRVLIGYSLSSVSGIIIGLLMVTLNLHMQFFTLFLVLFDLSLALHGFL